MYKFQVIHLVFQVGFHLVFQVGFQVRFQLWISLIWGDRYMS